MDASTFPPAPTNEPNLTYAPGTTERKELLDEIKRIAQRWETGNPKRAPADTTEEPIADAIIRARQ